MERGGLVSGRTFPSGPVPGDGVIGEYATCGACGITEYVKTQTGLRRLPPVGVIRALRRHGWFIGSQPKKDRCPDCLAARKKLKHPAKEGEGMAHETPVVELRPPMPGASEHQPRAMTREDRRLVFAKLEEVYVDERTGYSPGWNDHRVAEDMNCPRKWVETIRDENFGPQRTDQSAEVIELSGRIQQMERDGAALVDEATQIRRTADEARVAAALIEGRGRDLLKGLESVRGELRKLVGGR